jgi:hypothetical protein
MLSQWYHIYNVLVLFPSGAQLTLVTGPFLINRTKLKSKPNGSEASDRYTMLPSVVDSTLLLPQSSNCGSNRQRALVHPEYSLKTAPIVKGTFGQ